MQVDRRTLLANLAATGGLAMLGSGTGLGFDRGGEFPFRDAP